MIQRVQSIYLLLAAIACALMAVFSIAKIETPEHRYFIETFGVYLCDDGSPLKFRGIWALAIVASLASALSLCIIFFYRKRQVQMTLCKLNLLLYLGVICIVFYTGEAALSFINNLGSEGTLDYKFGAVLPILSVIFVALANRAIGKDEELVRSADRIR